MYASVLNNLKRLFTGTYVFTMVLYLAFAWTISMPPFNVSAIYNSIRLTGSYTLVLNSIAFLTFIFSILLNFKDEMTNRRKEILLSRLTKQKLFWALTFSYFLFFFLGFFLPFYGLALIQQVFYSPGKIDLLIYISRLFSSITGYYFFWILLIIPLFVKLKNEFIVLMIFLLMYWGSEIIKLISKDIIFNNEWIIGSFFRRSEFSFSSLAAWLLITLSLVFIVYISVRKIMETDIIDPYKKGILVVVLERLKLYLSMYHLRMIGLGSQKILMFFTLLGLLMVIMLLSFDDANLLPFAKIYLGALVPILFSFNQYYIVSIDKDAGMHQNIFIKELSYIRIVLNRWMVVLVPQLSVAIIYSLIISIFGKYLPLSFILYLLLINIFCSLLNLFFGILTRKSGIANLLLLFFIYIQLRADFQNYLSHYSFLKFFNVFEPLVRESDSNVSVHRFIIISAASLLLFLVSLRKLDKKMVTQLG